MVSPFGETPTYSKDNVNKYMSSILAWIRGPDGQIGQRNFTGFRVYASDDDLLSGLRTPYVIALTQNIACNIWLSLFRRRPVHGFLYNETLTNSICDPSCGISLRRWFDGVTTSCAEQNVTEAVPTKVGGYIYQGYNETCFLDKRHWGVLQR